MNVIILTPKQSLNRILEEHFRDQFKAKVRSFTSWEEAIEDYRERSPIDLVVVRNSENQDEGRGLNALKMLNIVYDTSAQTKTVVIGDFDHSFKKYEVISDNLRIEELNRVVMKLLDLKKEEFQHLSLPDFISIPVKDLNSLEIVPCDLFIKLNRKGGEDYLKRFKEGDSFSMDDIKAYLEAGVENLFIRKEDREVFYQGFTRDTFMKLKEFNTVPIEEKVQLSSSIFQSSSHFMRELGLTETTLQAVEMSIRTLSQIVSTEKKLGNLLKKLLTSPESYSFKRSAMISAISYHILPDMDWGNGDQLVQIFNKINTVSFYHDLVLEDEESLKILFKEQFTFDKNLKFKQREAINNHAYKMATLLQGIPKLPQGVDIIVKQHHGQSNGIGFPDKLSSAISPMAIFFIVIEHFVTLVLEDKNKIDFRKIFDELYKTHTIPSYRKIVDVLKNKFYPQYQ